MTCNINNKQNQYTFLKNISRGFLKNIRRLCEQFHRQMFPFYFFSSILIDIDFRLLYANKG